MKSSKIVVLGGSFNPPTLAHKELLEAGVRELDAMLGIYVPSSDAYVYRKMSKVKENNKVFSERQRYTMLKLMCEEKTIVSTVEYGDNGRGNTYSTLCKIQDSFPDSKIYFIIGSDKLKVLPRWFHKDDLLDKFYFLVSSRDSKVFVKEQVNRIPELREVSSHFIELKLGGSMCGISSTKAREYITLGDYKGLRGILSKQVIEYIKYR